MIWWGKRTVKPGPKKLALFSAAVNGDNSGDALIVDSIRRLLAPNSFEVVPLLQPLSEAQLEQVNGCDMGIICGTNLYQHVFACALTAQVLRRIKIPLLPLGIGGSAPIGQLPRMDSAGTKAVRLIHDHCAVGSVRDPLSLDFVRSLGIRNVALTGCPVLFHALKEPEFRPPAEQRLYVSVRARLLQVEEHWGAKQRQTLETLCARFQPMLILQSPYDLDMARELASRFKLDYVHDPHYGHEVMVTAARQASRVAGFRLHFGMVALSYGKPAVFIATDTRTSEFCRMTGLPYHDIHTYRDQDLIEELESVPPQMEAFIAHWRRLRAAMATVLDQNSLVHTLSTLH